MLDERFSASPVYQWTLETGRTEGIPIGKAEGIAIGKERGIALGKAQTFAQMRKRVIDIAIDDFPSLISLTNEVVAAINDFDALFSLAINLVQAWDCEQAEQLLLNAQVTG